MPRAIRAGTLMCRVIADAVEEGRFIASRRAARYGPVAAEGPPVLSPEEETRRVEQQRDARRQAALAQAEREARLEAMQRAAADKEQSAEPEDSSEGEEATGAAVTSGGAAIEPAATDLTTN